MQQNNGAASIPTEEGGVSDDDEGTGLDPAEFDVVTQEPLHIQAYAQQL